MEGWTVKEERQSQNEKLQCVLWKMISRNDVHLSR